MRNLGKNFVYICILLVCCSCGESKKSDYDGIPKNDKGIDKVEAKKKAIERSKKVDVDTTTTENNDVTETTSVNTTTDNNTPGVVHSVYMKKIGYLRDVFNDINDVQIVEAEKNGIKPINSLKDAYAVSGPIEKIQTCKEFYLDTLSHSLPYLRPKAHKLLKEIGHNFTDSIIARSGGHSYTIRVTSVLRTEASVSELRKHNRNASDNSAHRYGTTFDISWIKFIQNDPNYQISLEGLKNVLAEVVYDLRQQGRCYVKYEKNQGCFHITVR